MEDIELHWSHDTDPASALMQKMHDACILGLIQTHPRPLLPDYPTNDETEPSTPLFGNQVSAQELKAHMEDTTPRIKTIIRQTAEGRRLNRRLKHRLSEKTFPPRNPCKRKELKERKALLQRKKNAARQAGARVLSLRRSRPLSARRVAEREPRMLACCRGF